MINFFKRTPAFFHILFIICNLINAISLTLMYQIEILVYDVPEMVFQMVIVFGVVMLALYIGCLYFFNRQYEESATELFQYIEQNKTRYYVPLQGKQSMYLNKQTIEQYNAMAEDFLAMMNAEKNRLDTTISYIHDMKLPLTAISLVLDKIEPTIKYEDYLTMQTSLQRLNKYIKEQLYISQLTDLTNNLYYEEVDINALWSEVLKELQAPIMLKKLHINKVGESALVKTDRRMLQFIFMQLLQNAIQYTQQGSISIIVNEAVCIISDTGVGIPDYEMPMIFKRGYTGKVYRQQKQSGMGLYLANRLAEVLDIQIKVESKENEGTTFSLIFNKE